MSDDISAYEQQRLDNIARNQEVLVGLGLADGGSNAISITGNDAKKGGSSKKRKQRKVDEDSYAPPQPVRRCSRLEGAEVKTYEDAYAELDILEQEEKKQRKMEARQSKIQRFSHDDYVRAPRAPRAPRATVVNTKAPPLEYKRLTHDELMQCAPSLVSSSIAPEGSRLREELEKLVKFNFTEKHLLEAGYPPDKVKLFKEFVGLVKRSDNFVPSNYKLRPYSDSSQAYRTMYANPHVICHCGACVCLTEQGFPRKHDCV